MPKLEEVFGISRKPLKSYVERPHVDRKFVQSLKGECHIVVYGSSKQGKSSLRQKHLADGECTVYRCSPATTALTIYQQILEDARVRLEVKETAKTSDKLGGKATFSYLAWIPFLGSGTAGGEVSGERASETAREIQYPIPDLEDAQTVCNLLNRVHYAKWVVLENYHYLPVEVQVRLAYDLRTFQEVGIRFIILGIWKEANLLTLHNGDLQDRVVAIPVEPWEEGDFEQVIAKGEKALKISLSPEIKDALKANAYGNIGLLQGFLRRFCELNEVEKTQEKLTELNNTTNLGILFSEKLAEYRGRLSQAVLGIAAQSPRDGEKPLVLPYYLVRVFLAAPIQELQLGISRDDLFERIKKIHYREDKDGVLLSDLVACLNSLPNLQQNMQPPLLHYDVNQQRLKLVDTTQFFVLSRLTRDAVQREIPHPLGISELFPDRK